MICDLCQEEIPVDDMYAHIEGYEKDTRLSATNYAEIVALSLITASLVLVVLSAMYKSVPFVFAGVILAIAGAIIEFAAQRATISSKYDVCMDCGPETIIKFEGRVIRYQCRTNKVE